MMPAAVTEPRALRAESLLFLTAAIWGLAFVAQRAGMEHLGPLVFNGLRFALGCLVVFPVWMVRRRRRIRTAKPLSRDFLVAGAALGGILFLGATLQQVGLVYTTAGKAGFITGLYVVLVPLLGVFWRHRVGLGGWAGASAAAVGLYLLSVRGGLRMAPGDGLVVGSALCWAVHVLVVARWSRRFDPLGLALVQFVICSLLSLGAGLATEAVDARAVLQAGIPILYAGAMSVGVGYTLQVVAQRDAQPTAAAILMSLEAVFAALGGWILLGESLSPRGLAGCALMLGGVILSQTGPGAEPP